MSTPTVEQLQELSALQQQAYDLQQKIADLSRSLEIPQAADIPPFVIPDPIPPPGLRLVGARQFFKLFFEQQQANPGHVDL